MAELCFFLPLAQTGWHSWVQTNALTIIGRALYQLSYAPRNLWCSQGDLNPCTQRERLVS